MSSIAKTNISLSKKDLTKSRIPPVASRNVVFYHKATVGAVTINLLSLTMPSAEMPNAVQATVAEISGAQLTINKKNLSLVSSAKGPLIQNLDYTVVDSTTIQLLSPLYASGAESNELFVGTINSAPISDLVVASAKSITKTYILSVGSTTLNLGQEYKVGENPNEDVGIIKVYVNGILAIRGTDYNEVDSGNGYGTTIQFIVAPPTVDYQVVVDFGVMSITDNDAIGAIENLAGSIQKIATDLADIAGTTAADYYTASPSDTERRVFGDKVLSLDSKYNVSSTLTSYTKTKWQQKVLASTDFLGGNASSNLTTLTFNNLSVGKTYRLSMLAYLSAYNGASSFSDGNALDAYHNSVLILEARDSRYIGSSIGQSSTIGATTVFTATATTVTFVHSSANGNTTVTLGGGSWVLLEELPNHEATTQWT